MFLLPVADLNSQAIEAVLDDVLFYIILDWNDSGGYWELGIRNSAYQTLVDGVCVAPNYPLLQQFKFRDMPRGDIHCTYTGNINGPPPRDGFVNGVFELIYLEAQDLLDISNAIR